MPFYPPLCWKQNLLPSASANSLHRGILGDTSTDYLASVATFVNPFVISLRNYAERLPRRTLIVIQPLEHTLSHITSLMPMTVPQRHAM